MRSSLFLILLIIVFDAFTQSLQGIVISDETEEPLPFATISFHGTTLGTVSNKNGDFILQVPEGLSGFKLEVSYLGYETKTLTINNANQKIIIRLKEKVVQLDNLIVTPLSPTDYIKRAVKKIPQNYARNPYGSQGYYREFFVENGDFINGVEGVFRSYFPSSVDTVDNQHQLILYRQVDDLRNIAFAKRWIDKRQEKEIKKAARKDEEPEDFDLTNEIRNGFGGPDNILTMDLSNGDEDCLDSTQFNKFRYELANGITYRGRDLLVINFETKRIVDHTRQKGRIYIDLETDAFVAIDYEGEAVVPAIIRPLLFTFGLKVENPQFVKKVRYQLVGDHWFPENFQWSVDVNLVKRYTFHPNDKSHFFIEQLFKVNEIDLKQTTEIPEDKWFDGQKKMEEQVFPISGVSWEQMNTLIPESEAANR